MADDWLRLNRAWWDERALVHAASGFYDVPGFLAGKDSLRAFEPGEVGDVRGKRLLHLMCHIGLDTLSWARRGAVVTGLDFSQSALDTAVSLAGRAGIGSARFVAAEIGDANRALAGETFDIVYTGTGVSQWIPDIDSWARTVAALVAPGGFFYIAEYHPFPDCFDIVDGDRAEPRDHEARRLAMRQMGRLDNFGIHRVERLDGNIGYLDVRRVAVPANAGPAISAAMELVAGTYALIIDLRHNGGGSPEGVVFWCSYLFTEQPTHLNDIFHADTGETRQFWALPYVPGTRYVDRPVYVLTSSHTFSGGEDFCYTLQALGRAELIGETTGGGAHPTRGFPISPAVHIGIPFARSINPITGTNWQGTGVVPDIAVPEAEAYDVAYARALRHVLALDDLFPPIEDEARDALAGLPATASVLTESAVAASAAAGPAVTDPAVTESPAHPQG